MTIFDIRSFSELALGDKDALRPSHTVDLVAPFATDIRLA